MRKRISFFTFLLCVFAAVGPLASLEASAATDIRVTTYGIIRPGDETKTPDVSNEATSYFDPLCIQRKVFSFEGAFSVFVKTDTPGWRVLRWLEQPSLCLRPEEYKGNEIAGRVASYTFDKAHIEKGGDSFLVVEFEYVPLTVSFNPNGGSGPMSPLTDKTVDSEFDLPACKFVRAGYSMTGWTNDVETAFDDGQKNVKGSAFWETATTNFSSVLYAKWKANDSTLSYDLDGGNWAGGSVPSSATFDKSFELRHPVKPGSTFSGWRVIAGLDPSTAKYGSSATAINSSIGSAETLCKGTGDSTFFINVSTAPDAAVKFQAVWQADGYTVTFDNQGADSGKGGISSMKVNYGVVPSNLKAAEIPFKTGFDFEGYFEGKNGTGEQQWNKRGAYQFPDGWPYTEGKTLYAGWKAHHYSISYEGLAEATGYPTSAAYGETFSLKNPEKTGHKFAGWNVTAGLASKDAKWGELPDQVTSSINSSWTDIKPDERNPDKTVYIKNLNTNDNAQVTLTANWVEVKYKATFEIAGVRYPPTTEVEVTYNGALPKVTVVPEYISGEIFRGYFTEPNGQGEQFWDKDGNPCPEGRVWPFDGDRMLYEYKTGFDYYITYDANGGEGSVPQQSCNSSNDVTLASGEELHRSGFRLCGWDFNKDISPEKCAFQISQTVSFSDLGVKAEHGTAALFAIWQDKHVRIAIDATGGTAYTNGVKVTELTYVDGEEYGFLPTAEKPHYVFAGWFTQAEGGDPVTEDSTVDFESANTLYAHWTPEKFFVAFDRNGATNADAMAVQAFNWNEEQALSANCYGRPGYVFGGWATNVVTMKKVFDDRQVVSNLVGIANATQTVYAVWHTNRYTVAFNPGGATGTMEDQSFVYDQPQALRNCTFDRGDPALWSFVGWTNSAAGGPLYTNQETVVNLTDKPDGRVELTAVWKSELSDLALAMGCDNLNWTTNADYQSVWEPGTVDFKGAEISCALIYGGVAAMDSSAITTNGVLHFWWKATGARLSVLCLDKDRRTSWSKRLDDGYSYDAWNEENIAVSLEDLKGDRAYLSFVHREDGTCYIAKMTWTPDGGGGEPTPGEAVSVTAADVEGNVFSLTIPTANGTDYGVWTNADLTVDSWGLMGEPRKGEGKPLEFKWTILPEFPQLFFRAHKVDYK